MRHLRANTQVKVVIGPVVAVGDGFTPVTTLSLSTADEAELMKHDASAVTSISGATFAAITSMDGYYNLTLTASHTDTEGMLVIGINDDSLCLPIRQEFVVLSEAAYDSLYAAKDDGFMDVNIKTIGRVDTQETEANNLESACANYSATRGLSGTALPAAAADAAGGLPISDAGGLDLDGYFGDLATDVVDINTTLGGFYLSKGTIGATGNTTTTIHLSSLSYADDEIIGYLLVIEDASASGEKHARWITDWVNSSKLATVDTLPFTPEASVDAYYLYSIRKDSGVTAAEVRSEMDSNSTQLATISTDTGTIIPDLIGTPSDFGSGTSTLAANLQDLADNGTATYDRSTDSLQAIRDEQDSQHSTTQSRLPAALVSGRMASDVEAVNDDTTAASNLRLSSLAVRGGAVQTAESSANTNTVFDTNLPLENDDYYGDADGGLVIAFISGTAQQFQTRRIVASSTGSSNTRITLESALDGTPADSDEFVVLGRITELV